jgi:hypothetical protein
MSLPNQKILYLNAILLGVVLAHSAFRDFQLERQYPSDLRNRVVGARLQRNHIGPYTYYWKPADGTVYYDPTNINTDADHASNITASPFFHEIFYPLARLPQRQVSRIWCWMQYLFLGLMIAMSCALTADKAKKWIIINTGVLFTLTEAWKNHIAVGQLYIFEAFLMSCILFFLVRNKKYGMMAGGILAAAFVLTRPYAVVLFMPFLFYFKKYFLFLATSFAGLFFYALFVLSSSNERAVYANYAKGMQIQVKNHQSINPGFSTPVKPDTAFENAFTNMEGFKREEIMQYSRESHIRISWENGNAFVVYNKLSNRHLPLAALYISCLFFICLFSLLFFLYTRKYPANTLQIALFGLILYMIMELFSPIYRHQYNAVQWFPLVLAAIAGLTGFRNPVFKLLLAGLVLHIINISWPPMRHTLGELCWLIALLLYVFSSRLNADPWKRQ